MRKLVTAVLLLALLGLSLDNLALRRQRRRLRATLAQTGAELLAAALVQERAQVVLAERLASVWRARRVGEGAEGKVATAVVDALGRRMN